MKKSIRLGLILLITGLGAQAALCQKMVIQSTDGTEHEKNVNLVQNLTFPGSDLLVKSKDGSTETYALSTVRKIYFKGAASATKPVISASEQVVLYPNPTEGLLYLKNLPSGISNYKIFSVNGTLVLDGTVSADNQVVDVNQLSSGMYLFTLNNQVSKFVKQ